MNSILYKNELGIYTLYNKKNKGIAISLGRLCLKLLLKYLA